MDTVVGQMAGITPENLVGYAMFFVTYLMLILAHAISKINLLCLFITFASFYFAVKMVSIIPIGGVLFALLGVFYLIFFTQKVMKEW